VVGLIVLGAFVFASVAVVVGLMVVVDLVVVVFFAALFTMLVVSS